MNLIVDCKILQCHWHYNKIVQCILGYLLKFTLITTNIENNNLDCNYGHYALRPKALESNTN